MESKISLNDKILVSIGNYNRRFKPFYAVNINGRIQIKNDGRIVSYEAINDFIEEHYTKAPNSTKGKKRVK